MAYLTTPRDRNVLRLSWQRSTENWVKRQRPHPEYYCLAYRTGITASKSTLFLWKTGHKCSSTRHDGKNKGNQRLCLSHSRQITWYQSWSCLLGWQLAWLGIPTWCWRHFANGVIGILYTHPTNQTSRETDSSTQGKKIIYRDRAFTALQPATSLLTVTR